ncbi:hypothetical protein B879_03771 [Cecembia lonarensis LW9]|uniref:Uncharacterized protein n=1 Tax=Cecembia lonarensis (strain CCUG 58316 / KCTC 22772 / LW9) TaxID=1225176 RepID=K1L697_CECL9|nr:hypothetical protein B879_03771 [Cecembia lonarensis LW9]
MIGTLLIESFSYLDALQNMLKPYEYLFYFITVIFCRFIKMKINDNRSF